MSENTRYTTTDHLDRCDNCGRFGWHTTDRCPTRNLADVPHPAGAVHVAEWYDTQPGPYEARRYFRGSKRGVKVPDGDIAIEIDGTQGVGGDVTRHIMVMEGDHERLELSSDHARQLGRALIAAADEVERMAVDDQVAAR